MAIYLSHKLLRVNPAYGKGKANMRLKQLKSLRLGDSCNMYSLTLKNHLGTHVDCPGHFFEDGDRVADYGPDFWIFRNPQIIPVDAQPGMLISKKDINVRISPKTDLLLFVSGWSKFRDKDTYATDNPGLAPAVGTWIRNDFPAVRAIGIDWISISSYKHRDIGRKAHSAFLDPKKDGHPVLIIEDMFIPENTCFKKVLVCPLRVEKIDSAPCTIVGF